MIKIALLVVFFLTLTLDELLDIGLLIVPGLSAKNAFLYVMLLAILCSKVIDRSRSGFQFPAIHLIFILLIADASLSIFYMHFVSGDTAGYGLFGHIATMKGSLVDLYLMFLVFFYGLESRKAAVNFAKFFLVVISMMSLITLMDVLGLPDLGLMTYRDMRLEGPLGAANAYGNFLAFFIPILALAATGLGTRLLRLVYLLGAAVSFALLIQTGSRGGFAAMLVGVVLAAWWLWGSYDVRKVFTGVAVTTVAAVTIVTVVLATSEDVVDVVQQRIERSVEGSLDEISAGRLYIWAQGLGYQMAQPWTLIVGVGWWTFWDKVGLAPHNHYLNYLFSLGIIGLGLFLSLLYWILATAKRTFSAANASSEERLLIGGFVVGWFALVIAMMTVVIFKPWMFVWPFTGICMRLAYCLLVEERDQNSVESIQFAASPASQPRRLRV